MIFLGFMMYDLRFMIARCAVLALWRGANLGGKWSGKTSEDGQIIDHQS